METNAKDDIVTIPWRNDVQMLPTAQEDSRHDEELYQNTGARSVETISLHGGIGSSEPNGVEMHGGHHNDIGNALSCSSSRYEPTHPRVRRNSSASGSSSNNSSAANYVLSHQNHISMASKVAPLWFFSNYFYALSLQWTSISSSTVLANMGSIFAFMFATCSQFGDEKVTKGKLLGVMLCFMGGVATTWTDVGSNHDNSSDNAGPDDVVPHFRYLRISIAELTSNSAVRTLMGDLAGLVSAIGYGAYTVLIRYLCPKDEERMSMQLLLGYVGLMNMLILLPVAGWVLLYSNDVNGGQGGVPGEDGESPPADDYQTTTTTTTLTWSIFLFILLKGLLDNVVSDYLWARSVILTSATVASVGLGLTIPMAFVADAIMGNYSGMQAGEVAGALCVLFGFVLVNMNVCGKKRKESVDGGIDGLNIERGGAGCS